MKFSFSKKYTPKRSSDSHIKKLVRTLSKPPKVYEVHDLRNEKGHKYVGAADYKRKMIILDKNMTVKQKRDTVAHEVAHFKLREKGISHFSKKVEDDLKRSKLYKELKKEGYDKSKLTEEAFAEYYMKLKRRDASKTNKFEKKYPIVGKRFSKLAKGR
jgi:hypothetical protein